MKKYEYKVLMGAKLSSERSSVFDIEGLLNILGVQGWEMIPISSEHFYFKRELTDKEYSDE